MRHTVAGQRATTRESTGIVEFNSVSSRRGDDGQIEINQTRMVGAVALASIDAMGVVTHAAWGS